jgi:hypothetical protein
MATTEALDFADDLLCDAKAKINYALLSECIGEDDSCADALYRVIFAGKDTLAQAQLSLQDAFVAYLRTDVKAEEKHQADLQADWVESGLSHGGLMKRTGTHD